MANDTHQKAFIWYIPRESRPYCCLKCLSEGPGSSNVNDHGLFKQPPLHGLKFKAAARSWSWIIMRVNDATNLEVVKFAPFKIDRYIFKKLVVHKSFKVHF